VLADRVWAVDLDLAQALKDRAVTVEYWVILAALAGGQAMLVGLEVEVAEVAPP
jgi:hypothetical protein